MAYDYTKGSPQFGAILRILRKRAALIEHALNAADVTPESDAANLNVTNGFSNGVTSEKKVVNDLNNYLQDSEVGALQTRYKNLRARCEKQEGSTGYLGKIADDLQISKTDRSAGPVKYIYSTIAGVVTIIEVRGILGALSRDMTLNSKTMLKNTASLGAIVDEAGNRGSLALTSGAVLSHCFPGRIRVEVASEDVSNPKLEITHEFTNPLPEGLAELAADGNQLQPECAFDDGPIGLQELLLSRPGLTAPDVTDPNTLLGGVAPAIMAPATTDCDHGVFYLKITRQAGSPRLIVEIFSDGSRTTRVGRVTTDSITGTVALSVRLAGKTTLSFTLDRDAVAGVIADGQSDSSVSIDILTPREGDKWYIPVTNDLAGNWVTLIGQAWRITLPTADAGETFDEADADPISVT